MKKEKIEKLREILDAEFEKVKGIEEYCERCLKTERWHGSVVLMLVDAAFTSIGLNYFTSVVPRVMEFEEKYVKTGRIKSLKDIAEFLESHENFEKLRKLWKNSRSWNVVMEVAKELAEVSNDDREALRKWAKEAKLEEWRKDRIGRIKGVGISTWQYMRMMGGVDTVMPDKVVKRVINNFFEKAGLERVEDDIAFVKEVERISNELGYKAVELCWLTWLIQEQKNGIRYEKYRKVLNRI